MRRIPDFRRSLAVSVLFHFVLGLICFLLLSRRPNVKHRELTWIEVVPEAPPQARVKTQDSTKNQVVQTEKTEKSTSPAKDAFLGEQTQVVDRESVSSKRATIIGKARKSSSKAKPQTAALPQLDSLGVPMVSKDLHPRSDQQRAQDENWAAQGGDSPQDYVKGVREADRTLLNTKEFVFFGYYQRIRQRLDLEWVPVLREKLIKYYSSGRQLASDMDHSTKVLVTLNLQGEITAVKIVSESGTRDLDDAAVEAFNQAGPFPNPPRGIVGANGLIEIPWEFILRT